MIIFQFISYRIDTARNRANRGSSYYKSRKRLISGFWRKIGAFIIRSTLQRFVRTVLV